MARLNIDTGTVGNPATGDTLRTAMNKVNTNFQEVYSLVRDGSSGLIATDVTNGDLKLQANGTGAIEIDTLSVTNSTITSITTNSDITLTPNGTGNVTLGNFTFNADQTVGAGQDNFVFTYDHSTGIIGLEASAAGDVTASSTTTFTNKTFDANGTGNSISNIDIADFTSGVFLDEDNMASNSATAIASQQSIKAYVDTQVATVPTGDITSVVAGAGLTGGGTTGDVTLNVVGGTGIDANANDIAIDATVATLVGTQTLTNKTLTSPKLNEDVAITSTATELNLLDGITGIADEDNMSSNSATQLATQQSIKAYVDANSGGSTGDITFVGSTVSSPSNADITLNPGGTGGVAMPGITINDNNITGTRSNDDINITPAGTGGVVIGNVRIQDGRISSDDSTRLHVTDALEVSSIEFTDEGHSIGGTADPNRIFYSSGGGTGAHIFQGDVERMSGANLTTISDPDGSGTAAMIDTANGRNLVIHAGNGGDQNYSTLYLRGTKIELGEQTGAISIQENNITTTRSNDNLVLDANGTGGIEILTQVVRIANLPTSDPSSAGQLWNDSGTLKVSAG